MDNEQRISSWLLAAPVGFDERFLFRTILSLRLGLYQQDPICLFLPQNPEEKALRVINYINEMKNTYKLKINILKYEVQIDDFWGAAGFIRKKIEELYLEYNCEKIYVLFSGGMRILALEVLLGALATGKPGEVIVHKEDLSGEIKFPLLFITIKRPSPELLNILKTLAENPHATLTEISHALKMAKSTISKRLRELEDLGLIKIHRIGKYTRFEIMPAAKLWL